MSEYEYTNCGACGDRVAFGEMHECWVWNKVQTQETILETCPVCFEEVRAPHWLCEDRSLDVQP